MVVGFLLLAFFGAIIAYLGRGGTTGDIIIEITGLGKAEFNQSSVGFAMIVVSVVAVVYLLTKPPPSVLIFNKTQYSFAERLGQWRDVIFLLGTVLAAIILVLAYRLKDVMEHTKPVEIMNATPGTPGALLPDVYDSQTGTYFAPTLSTDPAYDTHANSAHKDGLTGKGQKVAVIDTGVLSKHPYIARTLKTAVDFIGEGPEDRHGHGTIVALLALMTAPDVDLYSLKVVNSAGEGSEEALIQALNWVAEHKIYSVNISLGVYRKLYDCSGDCSVCKAAERAAQAGCVMTVAAGNRAGETACPATLGVKKGLLFAVEAHDFKTRTLRSYSGIGNTKAPAPHHYDLVPVN